MTDPIRLARPDVGDAELAALAEVVGTGQLTMGPKVEEFEAARRERRRHRARSRGFFREPLLCTSRCSLSRSARATR